MLRPADRRGLRRRLKELSIANAFYGTNGDFDTRPHSNCDAITTSQCHTTPDANQNTHMDTYTISYTGRHALATNGDSPTQTASVHARSACRP